MPRAAVEVENLTITYRKDKDEFTAVEELSIAMNAGEITSILGPNGAGKTSTIEACEGFRKPAGGQIRVFGLDPIGDAAQLRPRVGVMLQDGGSWLGARAGELLRYVASLYANPLPAGDLLERLDMTEHRQTTYRRLSGGQRQRLNLAIAIVGRPELVFLDEPTAGMDPHARHETWNLIRELRSSGAAVVLSTHHMDEAQELSDQVHILNHGTLAATGSPHEILAQAARPLLIVEFGGAVAIQSLLLAIPELHQAEELGGNVFRFECESRPDLIAKVAQWCSDSGWDLRAIRTEQPTLEQRFLDITQRVEP